MVSDVGSRGASGAGGIRCVCNECSGCRETKPESGFSRKQWAARAHSRKCGSVRAWRGCGWSLLSHGAAERKWVDLGILNPSMKGSVTSQRYTIQMRRTRCSGGTPIIIPAAQVTAARAPDHACMAGEGSCKERCRHERRACMRSAGGFRGRCVYLTGECVGVDAAVMEERSQEKEKGGEASRAWSWGA